MNINFEDIITKANKRKDDLVALTGLLKQAPEMLTDLTFIHEWVGAVYSAYKALDAEGREMLPGTVQSALCSIASTRSSLAEAIGNAASSRGLGILAAGSSS